MKKNLFIFENRIRLKDIQIISHSHKRTNQTLKLCERSVWYFTTDSFFISNINKFIFPCSFYADALANNFVPDIRYLIYAKIHKSLFQHEYIPRDNIFLCQLMAINKSCIRSTYKQLELQTLKSLKDFLSQTTQLNVFGVFLFFRKGRPLQ